MSNKTDIQVIKIGGNVVDNPEALERFIGDFAQIEGRKILIHGGGKIATRLSEKLGIAVPTEIVMRKRLCGGIYRSKLFHILEFSVWKPGTCTAMLLPTVVYNLKGSVFYSFCELCLKLCVGNYLFITAFSVSIVPVVAAVNFFFWQKRIIAELLKIIFEAVKNITALIF